MVVGENLFGFPFFTVYNKSMLKRFYGQKTHVMLVYALLAFFSLAVFGTLHLLEGNRTVGSLELAGAAAVVFILAGLWLTKNVAAARANLLLTIMALLVVMLVTGGTAGTGIFWFFMFPVAAFFLAGRREGTFWMAFLLTMIIAVWATDRLTGVSLYYNGIEIRQLVATLVVVSVGVYVYQRSREASEATARRSQNKLKTYVREVEDMHKQMDRTKGEFLALASHQLRTPISGIRWYSEMLLSGDAGRLSTNQREYVGKIEESNNRQTAIVDAMLMVASLDLGQLEMRAEMIDLPKMARMVINEEKGKLPDDKYLDVAELYADKLPKLHLDKRIADMILRNVISNALKYTPSGGTVSVAISIHEAGQMPASVLIAVTDSGYGIPTSQQGDIFAKMFRADNAKAKETDGTGLGLYLVKAALDRIGGKIWFESEEGKGSTFWVSLPTTRPG